MNRKNVQGKTLKKKMAQVQFREGDPNRGTEVEKNKIWNKLWLFSR